MRDAVHRLSPWDADHLSTGTGSAPCPSLITSSPDPAGPPAPAHRSAPSRRALQSRTYDAYGDKRG
ncbi:hypothetical protein GCM10010335_47150 [Streptomyces galbus]|nr:hypothetical protein GCM10010335_47150 [Streptomyces galbus]